MNNHIHVSPGSRRQTIEQAIQLATASRWEEAEQLNRQLLASFPEDVDANNRLGKALTELGRYGEARAAYARALELDAGNGIARRNLTRLAALNDSAVAPPPAAKVNPNLFVEETGKSGVSVLQQPSSTALARMTAGDLVKLRRQDTSLIVEDVRGEYLGMLEPRVALRLIKRMDGGNTYSAAIASLNDHTCRVMIRETYQHPSQSGKLAFPPMSSDGFRPYTKESLIHYDLEDEETRDDEHEQSDEWEGDGQDGGDIPLQQLRRAELVDKTDDEEA
jgi:tetratricopeptide (TPR) repeat protein